MKNSNKLVAGKIRQSEHIFTLKTKTESNGFGALKTIIVMLLIVMQVVAFILSYLYLQVLFQGYATFAIVMTFIACINVLSSDYHGQAKATWVLFLLVCFGFGYVIYFMSDKHVSFAKSRKKFAKINKQNENLQQQLNTASIKNKEVKANCEYLYSAGKFVTFNNSKTTYYSSGTKFFDSVLNDIENAKKFIFMEYFIISDGVLLSRFEEVLTRKASLGVDVRIIYDDMGSHRSLKRKTKKRLKRAGIKLQPFNRLVPLFNIALNLRDHRKIVVIDGKISYTGGTNLADEYVNEKQIHGYWKDSGIKVEGRATDNFTIAFLKQWQFLTNQQFDYIQYLNQADEIKSDEVVVPFVSGPDYPYSIAQNIYANEISNAKEKLYIMTPYFIPDETIMNLLTNKARSNVDVRIILPEVADKKIVYVISRNNAEKLISCGVKLYTMKSSFVHSKVVCTENSAIVGSINMDLRSFNQQFESAVFTSEISTLKGIENDFKYTMDHSSEITPKNMKRNSVVFRIFAGFINLFSPFM